MADTLVTTSALAIAAERAPLWGPYWTSPTVGAMVYLDAEGDVVYSRTTDGGANWTPTEITTASTIKLGAYFDRETPEFVAGNLLHIVWIEATDGLLKYRTLDIANDSLGTERSVATLLSGLTAVDDASTVAVTKTRNGNLIVGGLTASSGGGANLTTFAHRSTDAGANWSSIATPYEAAVNDRGHLFPASTADDADAACVYYDVTTDELSIKMWDDSAGTWTETSISTGIDFGIPESLRHESHFDAALRHSDGAIIVAAWSEVDSATADLLAWTVTPNSIASPGVAAGANVLTDTAESGCASVAVNQQNGDVYVAYGIGGTWNNSVSVAFKISADDLTSFGTQQAYSETADDYKRVSGPRSIGAGGGRIQWAWYDDDDLDYFVNLVNDVEIEASGPAPLLAKRDFVLQIG